MNWKQIAGTVSAVAVISTGTALAQQGSDPADIELNDVVTFAEVTTTSTVDFPSDTQLSTLDESVASPFDEADVSPAGDESPDDGTDSPDSPESPDGSPDSPESPDSSPDTDEADSPDTSPDTDEADSPDTSPDTDTDEGDSPDTDEGDSPDDEG